MDLLLPASGLPPILRHLVQAIKDRKFVDFGDLLPEALQEAQFDKVSDKRDDSKTQKKYTITTPLDWMVSITTCMAVAVHFNTKGAFDLATHASIVLTLACDIKGSACAKYDRLFRQAAAVYPQLSWHRREQVIWMMSVTESTSLATAWPPSQQGLPSAPSSMEICRKWNRGSCPLSSAVTGTCALHARSWGTSPGTAHSSAHLPRPQPQGGQKAMSAGVIPLIGGTMVGLLLKHLKPFPSHSVMPI